MVQTYTCCGFLSLFHVLFEFEGGDRTISEHPTRPTQTSLRPLKKVTMSYDQTRRRHIVWIYDVLKKSDSRHLEDVQYTVS